MEWRLLLAWLPVLPILLCSCTTAVFSVKSTPLHAEVFVQNPNTGAKKSLGQTPLEMPIATVKETVGDDVMAGEFFTVSIEKQGYITQNLSIPASRFGTLVISLDVKLKEGEQKKEVRIAKEVLDHLFLAQKLALTHEFDRAQVELDKILSVAPDFARALSMRASIYFVQKNYPESLKWYEEALKSDPQMEEAVKMVSKIRAMNGGKLPAVPVTLPTEKPAPSASGIPASGDKGTSQ
jgi:tetratricopeptide (TPR) repeat protein